MWTIGGGSSSKFGRSMMGLRSATSYLKAVRLRRSSAYATEQAVDLIVMGTHGRTGLERLLMGSVAEQIVRGAPCSVLVVKMPKRIPVLQQAKRATTEMPVPAETLQGASLVR